MNALLRTQKGLYGLAGSQQTIQFSNSQLCSKKSLTSLVSHKSALRVTQSHSSFLSSLSVVTSHQQKWSKNMPTEVRSAINLNAARHFSLGSTMREQSSSKVEETVKNIQEKEKEKERQELATTPPKAVVKKSIKQRVWAELVHYYHGFRLLFIDINVASKLLWKVLRGRTLTRREHMLLIRTTGDVFRLVPFSVFIIVPFMEFLLPVFIKFFPGMLPSTFETAKDKEDKARKNLKVKLEMAKFLQKTLDEMDVQHKDHRSEDAKEFIEFFHKLRTSGQSATPDEVLKFAKLFEDEITLDSLSRQQLTACCKVLEVPTLGTTNFLRFQLRLKLRSLAADDRMIQKEGVETLTLGELQVACRLRGMRAYGLSEEQLKNQLIEWINLSLHEKVPPSLLLLSRAMMLPEDVPTTEKLKATISVLSDSAAIQTKAAIGEREGKIDNKTKIDIIRDEERKIKEELEELTEVEKGIKRAEILLDKAPVYTNESPQISSKDIDAVSEALGAVSQEKKSLLVEKEEIRDLKEEIADYKEDVEELQSISQKSDGVQIKESSASKMLLKKVDSMISKLDKVMEDLEKKEAKLSANIKNLVVEEDAHRKELVRIDEIMQAIRKMQTVPDESKVQQIFKMLNKIDDDKDGNLEVDDVLKVIETIGKDSVDLSEKQIDELIELISKEEHLENEDKIEKALAKSIEARQAQEKNEELNDEAKTLTDGEKQAQKSTKPKSSSKIDERINETVIQTAAEAAERQKDKILPPLAGGNDVPSTPQRKTGTGPSKPKSKML